MKSWKTAIGINGFTMVFGLTNHLYKWFCNGFGSTTIDADSFEVRQPLDAMVFQWIPMVAIKPLVQRWNGNDPMLWSKPQLGQQLGVFGDGGKEEGEKLYFYL